MESLKAMLEQISPKVKFTFILMFALLIFVMVACSYWTPDNPLEEAVEHVIEKETGVDVDLSPDSDEAKGKSLVRGM